MPKTLAIAYDRWSPRPLTKKKRLAGLSQAQIIQEMDNESTYRVDACKNYCKAVGLAIASVERDRFISARTVALAKRPAGAKLIEALNAGTVQHVVVYSQSRLFRDNIDGQVTLEKWRRAGVVLHLAAGGGQLNSGTAIGRHLIRTLLISDQFEAEQNSERTSNAMRSHQSNGRAMSGKGKIRYGWCHDPANPEKIIEVAAEQEILAKILELSAASHKPFTIAGALNDAGMFNRSGGPWHPFQIQRIVARQAVAV